MKTKTETTPASSSPEDTARIAADQAPVQRQNDRIAELDRRIAELSERFAIVSEGRQTLDSADEQLIAQQDEQIVKLQRLVANLDERLAVVRATSARDEQFNAAVRSVEAASAAVQRGLATTDSARGRVPIKDSGHDCSCQSDCEPCACVSCDCCTFEVWMSHVRVDQMQDNLLSPEDLATDSNLAPTNVMEIWMFASIDPIHNIGVSIPDPSPLSYIPMHKQITDPYGPWVTVNRCVGTATVKKNMPLTLPLTLTAVERENAVERLLPGNRDEWGSATENVTFDCCYSTYSAIQISVPLTSWGQGGGAITGRFIIVKKC